ncbi:MAG: 50S ribosomal protein L9 [Alphaproteobacteria bacterium]
MEIVLLERVEKLGQMGDVVTVKDGFARNFLLPQGKALRANKANLVRFENERAQLEARNLELKGEAATVAEKLNGERFIVIRQSGDTGQLYGSVSARDIADAATEGGFTVGRTQVRLNKPIKTLGLHDVRVMLHPEVDCTITVNVARTAEEAEAQARGENVLGETEEDREGLISAEDVFDPEALEGAEDGEEADEAAAEGEEVAADDAEEEDKDA